MMNSFYNGVEGVKTQSFGIDISANNISNVNTTGFKYSSAEFRDLFYSMVTTQSSNPSQAGHGASYAASKQIFEQGSPVASEGEFDVALEGKGFFGVLGADGNAYYTRNGSFKRDANGNLVDSYGNFVLGTMNPAFSNTTYSERVSTLMGTMLGSPVTSGFTVNSNNPFNLGAMDSQSNLLVPTNLYLPPQSTQNIKWSGSLNSNTTTQAISSELDPQEFTLTQDDEGKYIVSGSVSPDQIFSAKEGDKIFLNFKDDQGVAKGFETYLDANLNFTSNALDLSGLDSNTLKLDSAQIVTEQQKADTDVIEAPVYNADGSKGSLRVTLDRVLPDENSNIQYKAVAQLYDSNGEAVGEPNEGNLVFDENGALVESTLTSINNPNGLTINLDFGTPYDPNIVGSGYGGVYIQQGREKDIVAKQDGVAEGFFQKYGITDDGSIIAQFSNGVNRTTGKLALYNFINEQGLAAVGDNIFAATGNSGEASFITNNGELVNTAKFKGGFLEQSNVDLSNELTNLIVMQKAFDASSKSITTSDQMIQKAINMKR